MCYHIFLKKDGKVDNIICDIKFVPTVGNYTRTVHHIIKQSDVIITCREWNEWRNRRKNQEWMENLIKGTHGKSKKKLIPIW